ncbi:unnamed protein product, partial [Allacma fusca]
MKGSKSLFCLGFPSLKFSMDELEDMETKVRSNPETYSDVANRVDWVEGGDVRRCTNSMLRKLMVDAVAVQLNWKGRNNKKSFESYELSTIVVESVHFFFGKLNGNEAVIKNAIKDWLKAAQTRLTSNVNLDAVSTESLHV